MKHKIIKKLAESLTEDELCSLLIKSVEAKRQSKEEVELMFNDLKKVEGFQDYLTNTLVADKDRYFGAGSPMEQLMVKGAYNRTLYLRSKLREKKDDVKLESPRHA